MLHLLLLGIGQCLDDAVWQGAGLRGPKKTTKLTCVFETDPTHPPSLPCQTAQTHAYAPYAGGKDTGHDVIVERGEVFQGVHHGADEVVVPLDLRQDLRGQTPGP